MSATVVFPASTAEAIELVTGRGAAPVPLAGGTWVMRAGVRGEQLAESYVSLAQVAELRTVTLGEALTIGAAVTHAALARELAGMQGLEGLQAAAGGSANPAVRNAATVGGALATAAFAASDLVPALLAADAEVTFAHGGAKRSLAVEDYLAARGQLGPAHLITAVRVPRAPRRSAHARLTLRSGGDYPAAIVDVAEAGDGTLRVAHGSVEEQPARWRALEEALGKGACAEEAALAAERLAAGLRPRDDVEAPGWYRAAVLPELVRRAMTDLQAGGPSPARPGSGGRAS